MGWCYSEVAFLAPLVGCMLIGSDGEGKTWWGCQILLTEQSCSALSTLHCTRPELFALLLCSLLMKSLCEGWEGQVYASCEHPTQSRERRLFCALRKLILKVALLHSRTCKTGHHSRCCKKQMLSQNKRLLDTEESHKNQAALFSPHPVCSFA